MRQNVLVVGAGYAGVMAALRASRRARGRYRVTLLADKPHLVQRVRLHEHIARGRAVTVPLRRLLKGCDVELRIAHAEGIDGARGVVTTSAGKEGYEALVVCAGSVIDTTAVPGANAVAVAVDAGAARERIRALGRGGRILVCGGGFTGIETAAELAEARPDLRVGLVTATELGPPWLTSAARTKLCEGLRLARVDVITNTVLHAIAADGAETTTGRIPFDLCVWAGGFAGTSLLAGSGLAIDATRRARVDVQLRAEGYTNIFVAGDAAAVVGVPMGCKSAMPTGAHAASNAIACLDGKPGAPFAFADVLSCVSIGRNRGAVLSRRGALSGRLAAWVKEWVCRYVDAAMLAERSGLWEYRWPTA